MYQIYKFENPKSGITCKWPTDDMQTISSPYEVSLLIMHEFAPEPIRLREFEYP